MRHSVTSGRSSGMRDGRSSCRRCRTSTARRVSSSRGSSCGEDPSRLLDVPVRPSVTLVPGPCDVVGDAPAARPLAVEPELPRGRRASERRTWRSGGAPLDSSSRSPTSGFGSMTSHGSRCALSTFPPCKSWLDEQRARSGRRIGRRHSAASSSARSNGSRAAAYRRGTSSAQRSASSARSGKGRGLAHVDLEPWDQLSRLPPPRRHSRPIGAFRARSARSGVRVARRRARAGIPRSRPFHCASASASCSASTWEGALSFSTRSPAGTTREFGLSTGASRTSAHSSAHSVASRGSEASHSGSWLHCSLRVAGMRTSGAYGRTA